jgi:hypothetical protein
VTTPLEKTLKRALQVRGNDYVIAISPQELKITLKGRRNGMELKWSNSISGDAALAVALNASLKQLGEPKSSPPKPKPKRRAKSKR